MNASRKSIAKSIIKLPEYQPKFSALVNDMRMRKSVTGWLGANSKRTYRIDDSELPDIWTIQCGDIALPFRRISDTDDIDIEYICSNEELRDYAGFLTTAYLQLYIQFTFGARSSKYHADLRIDIDGSDSFEADDDFLANDFESAKNAFADFVQSKMSSNKVKRYLEGNYEEEYESTAVEEEYSILDVLDERGRVGYVLGPEGTNLTDDTTIYWSETPISFNREAGNSYIEHTGNLTDRWGDLKYYDFDGEETYIEDNINSWVTTYYSDFIKDSLTYDNEVASEKVVEQLIEFYKSRYTGIGYIGADYEAIEEMFNNINFALVSLKMVANGDIPSNYRDFRITPSGTIYFTVDGMNGRGIRADKKASPEAISLASKNGLKIQDTGADEIQM